MHKPRQGYNPVTFLHLCREVVVADANIAHYTSQVQWDLADAWAQYREDLQWWRYIMLRRDRALPSLDVCPRCRRVQESAVSASHCTACGWQWSDAIQPVVEEAAGV